MDMDESEYRILLRQRAVLGSFGELALRSDDLDEILTEACRLVGEAMGTDLAKVVELEKDQKTLIVRAGVGWKPGVVGVAKITIADDTSEALALKTGQPMISPDIDTETRFKYPSFLTENGVRAVANVLILGGKNMPPFGILQVDSREPRQFTKDDTAFLSGYANLIAAAVNRLRVVAELREREAQLRQAQRLEVIGRLAAGVAHDFNNILQSVTGGLELVLEDSEAGTSAFEFAEIALRSATRGSYLTGHLLAYARKQMLKPERIDVVPFLSDMQQVLSRTLGLHITVKVRAEPGLPLITVDPGQLHTALLNLAINASYAMSTGGTLTMDAQTHGGGNREFVIITIADTGVGMDAVTLGQAFEPFFSTKGLNGSGLGLSMVQGFAEQSGGAVHISSVLGTGTQVELRLPAAEPVEHSNKPNLLPEALRGSGCILLVDDAPDVLVTLGALLERAGFQVRRAGSGEKALAILSSGERFSALVTDYAMPGMNGLILIEQARMIQPELAALVITGFADADRAELLPETIAVLHKPVSRAQLVEAMLRLTRQEPDSTQDQNTVDSGQATGQHT